MQSNIFSDLVAGKLCGSGSQVLREPRCGGASETAPWTTATGKGASGRQEKGAEGRRAWTKTPWLEPRGRKWAWKRRWVHTLRVWYVSKWGEVLPSLGWGLEKACAKCTDVYQGPRESGSGVRENHECWQGSWLMVDEPMGLAWKPIGVDSLKEALSFSWGWGEGPASWEPEGEIHGGWHGVMEKSQGTQCAALGLAVSIWEQPVEVR